MTFALLLFGAYLLGALPVSYLVARLTRGIDLRKYGTNQVGAGNLWRMTSSWKIGLSVTIYDIIKGVLMVWLAKSVGMNLAQQMSVGLMAVIGHNWSVFLRFSGGRGIGTAAGLVLFVPIINGFIPWSVFVFLTISLGGLVICHSSPLPVLLGMAAAPIASWIAAGPAAFSLGFLAMFLILVIKRLSAERTNLTGTVCKKELFLNRLFFDRDIKDRKAWMYRRPAGEQE